jgi:hypothetical protein
MIAHKRFHQIAFGCIYFDFHNVVTIAFNDSFASMGDGAIIAAANIGDCCEFIAFSILDVSVKHF